MSVTNLERFASTTLHMELDLKDGSISNGTGFFFAFERTEKLANDVVIFTNKHVIEESTKLTLKLFPKKDNEPDLLNHFDCYLDVNENDWILHPNKDIDLCMLPFEKYIDKIQKEYGEIFLFVFDKSHIPSQEVIEDLNTIEEVIMIGYPLGLHDEANNIPFIRKGITSIHPKYDYNGDKEFIIDASILPGSSGSPVLIYDEGAYKTSKGNFSMSGRALLVGILYAEPAYELDGIVTRKIPRKTTDIKVEEIPTNLGFVIKSERILEMEKQLNT